MGTLLIAVGAGLAFIIAYHTYGKWLGSKIFRLGADVVCPSERLRDDKDYVPTPKPIVFGHHFTSIAGTGPIVGPAIAVMWGWLPALLWVVFGSIFIGAVHDFGALVVSLRNNGQTVGDIAGRVLNKRVRLLFLFVLFMALTIVLAIFGLVIGAVFDLYPTSIFPCVIQIPIAVGIGLWLHRKGINILIPSIIALAVMYLSVIFGDRGFLHSFNFALGGEQGVMGDGIPIIVWVAILLVYSYIASVLPVWTLLQPRDYINSLQLISALVLIVVGLGVAAAIGGAPPVEGAARQSLEVAAPMWNLSPEGAPLIFPFLFITIACGAISGFHCLVSSGTSSKQIRKEPDARFVGYGSMLTEGFLATLVIVACVAGLGLGVSLISSNSVKQTAMFYDKDGMETHVNRIGDDFYVASAPRDEPAGLKLSSENDKWIADNFGPQFLHDAEYSDFATVGPIAWKTRYRSWSAAGSLGAKVGAFVDGAANFLKAMGIPAGVAIALMGVLVASFAGTTLDTACRLQRYVVQELAGTFLRKPKAHHCEACGYDLTGNASGKCPECGAGVGGAGSHGESDTPGVKPGVGRPRALGNAGALNSRWNPFVWLANKHGATVFAIVVAIFIAALPAKTPPVGLVESISTGIPIIDDEARPDLWNQAIKADSTAKGLDGAWIWLQTYSGKGGMILWPLFGATNQLLGGLSFLVISFYLWRRKIPVWFIIPPLIFMLIMPAWAMVWQLFVGSEGHEAWLFKDSPSYTLIGIGFATLVLEVWMIVEAILLWPKVRGVLETQLPGNASYAAVDGMNC